MRTWLGYYAALNELIDIAIVSDDPQTPESIQKAADNNKMWRDFIASYLDCLDMLLDSHDFTEVDYKEMDKRGKKMYRLLVAGFGIEGCTNDFHYVGSGHIVWLMRNSGNLWRLRNEGVEAFNSIMSLRHATTNITVTEAVKGHGKANQRRHVRNFGRKDNFSDVGLCGISVTQICWIPITSGR